MTPEELWQKSKNRESDEAQAYFEARNQESLDKKNINNIGVTKLAPLTLLKNKALNKISVFGRFIGSINKKFVIISMSILIAGVFLVGLVVFHYKGNQVRSADVRGRMDWERLNFSDDECYDEIVSMMTEISERNAGIFEKCKMRCNMRSDIDEKIEAMVSRRVEVYLTWREKTYLLGTVNKPIARYCAEHKISISNMPELAKIRIIDSCIKKHLEEVANDPAFQKAVDQEMKNSFWRMF